jgi:hypothetical protein
MHAVFGPQKGNPDQQRQPDVAVSWWRKGNPRYGSRKSQLSYQEGWILSVFDAGLQDIHLPATKT